MEGKKKRGGPRMMLLDRVMKEDCSKLKKRAGHRAGTCLGRQRTKKKKSKIVYT